MPITSACSAFLSEIAHATERLHARIMCYRCGYPPEQIGAVAKACSEAASAGDGDLAAMTSRLITLRVALQQFHGIPPIVTSEIPCDRKGTILQLQAAIDAVMGPSGE